MSMINNKKVTQLKSLSKVSQISSRNLSIALDHRVDFYIFTHASSVSAAIKALTEHREGLEKLLTETLKGVLIVYVAPGDAWRRMIRFVSNSHSGFYGFNFIDKMNSKTQWMKGEYDFLKQMDEECQNATKNFEKNSNFLQIFKHGSLHRVRFVSPISFIPIFDRIKSRQRDSFVYWFEQSTYDVPKLADAMIRLRNVSSQIPVLRFDFDVLFSNATLGDEMLKIRHSVIASVKQFRLRMKDVVMQSWIFSGQYFYEPLHEADNRKEYSYWAQAFSTRASPTLLLTKHLCNPEQFTTDKGWTPDEDALNNSMNETLLFNWFGLQVDPNSSKIRSRIPSRSCESDILQLGHAYLGANPLTCCVSGSSFCVSSSISLDLPPFSNFRSNVLWIDDDLLHRFAQRLKRINHFSTPETDNAFKHYTAGNPVKERNLPENVLWYTLEIYLPTFLYGCVVDSWLTAGRKPYLEKFEFDADHDEVEMRDNLDDLVMDVNNASKKAATAKYLEQSPNAKKLTMLQSNKDLSFDKTSSKDVERKDEVELLEEECKEADIVDGPLVNAAREVLNRGRIIEKDVLIQYRNLLRERALNRIKEIYFQLRELKTSQKHSIASLWVTGSVRDHEFLKDFCADNLDKDQKKALKRILKHGQGLVRKEYHDKAKKFSTLHELPELSAGDLNPAIAKSCLEDLIDDAMNYLEWILVWPTVVQAVRADCDGRSVLDPVFVENEGGFYA